MKLKLEDLEEEFFRETRIIGIVAPLRDYQFCWILNQTLHFNFRNNNDIEIQLNRKDRKYYFSVFEYCEKNCSLNHYLYNNQFDGEYLLPEFRHLDFLWLLKGDEFDDVQMEELIAIIKNINGVQLAMELGCDLIKNKAHLIF